MGVYFPWPKSCLTRDAGGYDAGIGRWWVKDPMIEKHFESSPYSYVYNNPIILLDPNGLDSIYVFDQSERPPDNGTPGTSYTATIMVIQNGSITGIFDGSSYPNSVSPNDNSPAANTVNDGEFSLDNAYGHNGSITRGLIVYDNSSTRTSSGTNPTGEPAIMSGVNVHTGTSNDGGHQSRGSIGCITIDPNQWADFSNLFDWSGTIARTRSSITSQSFAEESSNAVTNVQNENGTYTVTGSTGQSSGSMYIYRNQTIVDNLRRDHRIIRILQEKTPWCKK